jgi:hypothetical protein
MLLFERLGLHREDVIDERDAGRAKIGAVLHEASGSLAPHVGVGEPTVDTQRVCVDKSRQWRFVRNLKHSATIDSMIATATAPIRWVRRRTGSSR